MKFVVFFKRVFFFATAIFVCLELFSFAYLRSIGTRSLIPSDFIDSKSYFEQFTSNNFDCDFRGLFGPHPYLSFSARFDSRCSRGITSYPGFRTRPFPIELPKDSFSILVSGGSVADECLHTNKLKESNLEIRLNRTFVSPNRQPFRVFNGSLGAFKLPQQTILFLLYADRFHALITLDGFNELWPFLTKHEFNYPASHYFHMNPFDDGNGAAFLYVLATTKIESLSRRSYIISKSNFIELLQLLLINRYNTEKEKFKNRSLANKVFRFPSYWHDAEKIKHNRSQLVKYYRVNHAIASRLGKYSAFFLQPVPAIGKMLTIEEKSVVGQLDYGKIYRENIEELLKLDSEGVNIFNLGNVFSKIEETIYRDAIHFVKTKSQSEGCERVIVSVVKLLGEKWKLKRKSIAE